MCTQHIQLTNVVEMEVLKRVKAQESFTALDISNALKAERYPFRHHEVAEVVRDIYCSGALEPYEYYRRLIPVLVAGGPRTAQAYLYFHSSARPDDYVARNQAALAPVPAGQARDLDDSVAADPLHLLPRPTQPQNARPVSRFSGVRRDGALAIPRRIIAQLGWTVGHVLPLKAEQGYLTIGPGVTDSIETIRVWGGPRVRVSKLKLRLGALAADVATIEVDGDTIKIEAK